VRARISASRAPTLAFEDLNHDVCPASPTAGNDNLIDESRELVR